MKNEYLSPVEKYPNDAAIENFNSLLYLLNDTNYLECNFGRDSYRITRADDNYLIETKFHLFTSRYEKCSHFSKIEEVLNQYPQFYAANVHTGELLFKDNWPTFLAAFKLKENKKDD